MRTLFAVSALVLISASAASAADAHAVLAAPQQRIQTADFRARGHLIRVYSDGMRANSSITIKAHWFPGVLRVMVEIGQPPEAHREMREKILLEMRPDGQNTIRVALPGSKVPINVPFEKWLASPIGPGFAFEDFLEPQYFWPGQAVVEGTKRGTHICDVLKSTPGGADRTHYAEVRTWLEHDKGFPLFEEKTLKATGEVKEFTYSGLHQVGGVWAAHQLEAKTRGQGGSTLLILDRGSTKAKLGLGDFSPEQLIQFQDF